MKSSLLESDSLRLSVVLVDLKPWDIVLLNDLVSETLPALVPSSTIVTSITRAIFMVTVECIWN